MANFKELVQKNLLLLYTFTGILVGVGAGFILKYLNVGRDSLIYINYPGELFLRGIWCIILPVVVFSLIAGSASLNIKENGRIAVHTFSCFLFTSFVNACIGILLVILIRPGILIHNFERNTTVQTNGTGINQYQPTLSDNLFDLGRNIVPNNILTPLFQQTKTVFEEKRTADGTEISVTRRLVNIDGTNFIGLVTICLVTGSILSTLGEEVKILIDVIKACDHLATRLLEILIWTMPIGVAFIICGKIFEVEDVGGTMETLGWLILTVGIGILVNQFIVMPLIYLVILRENPFPFYFHIFPALLMAFVTRSSAVTLPLTLRCMDENTQMNPKITHFILPIGVTINKNGTALFITVASVFLAQLSGVSLTMSNYITICLIGVAMSIAAGGPSGSLFILQTLGIPIENIALLFAIDWLLDRMRTMNNVLGDCYSAAIVDHLSRKHVAENEK